MVTIRLAAPATVLLRKKTRVSAVELQCDVGTSPCRNSVNLVPLAKRLLDLLSREPSGPAQDRQDLASLLFATVLRSTDRGGKHPAEGAIDVNSTLRVLDDALMLVEKARAYVGIP